MRGTVTDLQDSSNLYLESQTVDTLYNGPSFQHIDSPGLPACSHVDFPVCTPAGLLTVEGNIVDLISMAGFSLS